MSRRLDEDLDAPVVRYQDDAGASQLKQRLLSKLGAQLPKKKKQESKEVVDSKKKKKKHHDARTSSSASGTTSLSNSFEGQRSQDSSTGAEGLVPRGKQQGSKRHLRLFRNISAHSSTGGSSSKELNNDQDVPDYDALLAADADETNADSRESRFDSDSDSNSDSGPPREQEFAHQTVLTKEDRKCVNSGDSDSDSDDSEAERRRLLGISKKRPARCGRENRSHDLSSRQMTKLRYSTMPQARKAGDGSDDENSSISDDSFTFANAGKRAGKTTMSQFLGNLAVGKHKRAPVSKVSRRRGGLQLTTNKRRRQQAKSTSIKRKSEVEEIEEFEEDETSRESIRARRRIGGKGGSQSQSQPSGDFSSDDESNQDQLGGGKDEDDDAQEDEYKQSTGDIMKQLLENTSGSRKAAPSTVQDLLSPGRPGPKGGRHDFASNNKKTSRKASTARASQNDLISQCILQVSRARSNFANTLAASAHWQRENATKHGIAASTTGQNPWLVPCLKVHVGRVTSTEKRASGTPAHIVQADVTVLELANFALNQVALNFDLRVGQKVRLCFPRTLATGNAKLSSSSSSSQQTDISPTKYSRRRGNSQQSNGPGTDLSYHLNELGHLHSPETNSPVANLAGCEISIWWPWVFSRKSNTIITQSIMSIDRINVDAPLWAAQQPASTCRQISHEHASEPNASEEQAQDINAHNAQADQAAASDADAFEDDALFAELDLGDGWSSLHSIDILGQKKVTHFSAVVECSVMRDALKFSSSGLLCTDSSPPGSMWSSVLLSRPIPESTSGGATGQPAIERQYCEIIVPPQYVESFLDLFQEDQRSVFTITNAKQVAVRSFQKFPPAQRDDALPAPLRGGLRGGLSWDVVVAQHQHRPDQYEMTGDCLALPQVFEIPVLQCNHETRALRAPANAQVSRRIPRRRLIAGTHFDCNNGADAGNRATSDQTSKQNDRTLVGLNGPFRGSILCRLVHLHCNVLFVLDAAQLSDRALTPLIVLDRKLCAAVLAQCAKGCWILCRDVLLDPNAGVAFLDEASTVEKAELVRDLSMACQGSDATEPENIEVLLPHGASRQVVTMAWVRLGTSFPCLDSGDDEDGDGHSGARANHSSQSSLEGPNDARVSELTSLVNGEPTAVLHVPLLVRAIQVPDSFDIGLQSPVQALSEKLACLDNQPCPTQVKRVSGVEEWSLLSVDGNVTHFGFAHKINQSSDACDLESIGQPTQWRFSEAHEGDSLTVERAIELVRPPEGACDIALVIQLGESSNLQQCGSRHVFVRTRYHDLLKLVGHATADQPLLTALRALPNGVRLPCVLHKSDLHILAQSSQASKPIYLTSLALLDEQHCEILI